MTPQDLDKRWVVIITHRASAKKISSNTYFVEELEEIADIVEQGPHWGTLGTIVITLNRDLGEQCGPDFHQEKAMTL